MRIELPEHWGYIWSMAWSPDDQLLATSASDGQVRIWDPIQGKTLFTYRGHHSVVYDLAWSADSRLLASGDHYGEIHIWNALSGKRIAKLPKRAFPGSTYRRSARQEEYGIAFSPNGKEVAYTDGDALVRWNIQESKQVFTETVYPWMIDYSPSGDRMFSSGMAGNLVVWDLETNQRLIDLPIDQDRKIAQFQKDGTLTVVMRGEAQIWDCRKKQILQDFKLPTGVSNRNGMPVFQLAASGTRCILTGKTKLVTFDLKTNSTKVSNVVWVNDSDEEALWAISNNPNLVALSFGSPRLVVKQLSNDQTFLKSRLYTTDMLIPPPIITGDVINVNGTRSFDLKSGELVEQFPEIPFIRPDGRLFGLVENRILHWPTPNRSVEKRDFVAELEDSSEYLFPRRFWRQPSTLDGSKIITVAKGQEHLVRFWDSSSGKIIRTVNLSKSDIRRSSLWQQPGPSFSSSGDVMAQGFGDGRVVVWRDSMQNPSLEFQTGEINHGAYSLILSPDGTLVVTNTVDGSNGTALTLWDARVGRRVAVLQTGMDLRMSPLWFDFSSSSRYLLATRQIWDVANHEMVWECPDRDHAVSRDTRKRCGALFPDDRHVVIVQDIGEHHIWDWRENTKKATIYTMPHGNWAMVNHETGHWNGSNLAFQYLRFLHKDKEGREHWLTAYELEKKPAGSTTH